MAGLPVAATNQDFLKRSFGFLHYLYEPRTLHFAAMGQKLHRTQG